MVVQAYYQTPSHVIAAAVVLPAFDLLAVGLRFWARRKQRRPYRLDDWLIVPAALLTVGIGICLLIGVANRTFGYTVEVPANYRTASGAAGSPQDIRTPQLTLTAKLEYANMTMLPIALGCIKLSFLFFYRRIFVVAPRNKVDWMLLSWVAFIIMWTVTFTFLHVFCCGTRFWAFWGSTMDGITHCINTLNGLLALCVSDFITDVVIITIPIPLIWQLQLSKTKKVAISAIFLLGSVTIAASLTRMVVIARAARIGFSPDEDEILVITLSQYWGMIECGIGILAACLPSLRYFFVGITWQMVLNTTRRFLTLGSSRNRSTHGSRWEDYKDYTKPHHKDDSSIPSSRILVRTSIEADVGGEFIPIKPLASRGA